MKTIYDKNLTTKQRKCLNSIINRQTNPRPHLQIGNLSILGKFVSSTKLSTKIILALARIYIVAQDNDMFYKYKRCTIDNKIFHCCTYKRMSKRVNYNVIMENNEIIEIHEFLTIKRNNQFYSYLIGKFYEKKNKVFIQNRRLNHLIKLDK